MRPLSYTDGTKRLRRLWQLRCANMSSVVSVIGRKLLSVSQQHFPQRQLQTVTVLFCFQKYVWCDDAERGKNEKSLTHNDKLTSSLLRHLTFMSLWRWKVTTVRIFDPLVRHSLLVLPERLNIFHRTVRHIWFTDELYCRTMLTETMLLNKSLPVMECVDSTRRLTLTRWRPIEQLLL